MPKISKQEILQELKALKPLLKTQYGVKRIELFGSFVREEQNEKSDIDLLVEFSAGSDMFDLVGLGFFLEEKLQRHIDIVPKKALRPELRSSVLGEAVLVL